MRREASPAEPLLSIRSYFSRRKNLVPVDDSIVTVTLLPTTFFGSVTGDQVGEVRLGEDFRTKSVAAVSHEITVVLAEAFVTLKLGRGMTMTPPVCP